MKAATLDAELWRQVSEHLDQMLDLEPAERPAWLANLEKNRPGIARTLRDLVSEHDHLSKSAFLEGSALPLIASDEISPSMVGEQIGGYTIERLIGRGGMGAVWLAVRTDGRFEGRCAIKFIDGIIVRRDLVEHFQSEGRLLARLNHPNIARLLDAGATAEDKQFLVLEYIDGERIDKYCESRQLSVKERVRLFLQAVDAVAHAHGQFVVHRDLKPSNVLVTRDGVLKLLDFGVAKLLAEQDAGIEPRERVEDQAFTPEYAAPEQLQGEAPSAATDVYQLGMLLYALLTGHHPRTLSGDRAQRIQAALAAPIPPVSKSVEAAHRKELQGDLDAVLTKALNVDTRERYPTADALHEDLVRYLNYEPVRARRATALYRVRKFVARNRLLVAISSTAFVALCGALIFALMQARVATVERDRAIALALRNDAVSDFLEVVITEGADVSEPITVGEMLARSERLATLDSSGSPENRAAVLNMLAARYQTLGEPGKAVTLMERALALLATSPERDLRSDVHCGYALMIANTGRNDEALRIVSSELDHPPADPASFAQCLFTRAELAMLMGDARTGLEYALQALAKVRESGAAAKTLEAPFLDGVAVAYHMNGRTDEALRYYGLLLEQLSEIGRTWSPGGISAHNNYGFLLEGAGAPRRALETYEQTLKVVAARNPQGQPPIYLLVNRARALDTLGRYTQAGAAYAEALEVAKATKDADGEIRCWIGLARGAIGSHDLVAAERSLTQAMQLVGSPEAIAKFQTLVLARGDLALAKNDLKEAGTRFAEAAAGEGSAAAADDALVGEARVLLLSGDAPGAVAKARTALDSAKSLQGGLPYSQRVGRASLVLGNGLQKMGDASSAHEAFATAVLHLSNTVDADHPALVEARRLEKQ